MYKRQVDIEASPEKNDAERSRIVDQLLPELKRAKVKVHTIALSTNADVELLEALSEGTDGLFAVAEDAEALNKAFLRAFDQSVQGDQVPLEDNRFLIDSSVEEFTALVFKKDLSKATRLTSPAGDVYRADSESSRINWVTSEQYDLITIRNPGEGCLLYTSPSPRDKTVSRMPSSA